MDMNNARHLDARNTLALVDIVSNTKETFALLFYQMDLDVQQEQETQVGCVNYMEEVFVISIYLFMCFLGTRCSIEDCKSSAVDGKTECWRHGAFNKCQVCGEKALNNGTELCFRHGASPLCRIAGCEKKASGKGEFRHNCSGTFEIIYSLCPGRSFGRIEML